MVPVDFGLGILASWLANKVDVIFEPKGQESPELMELPELEERREDVPKKIRRFKTFDAYHDLIPILSSIDSPVASLLIERSPSTHYNLVSLVLESNATREWYVFDRGRMALQGTGGGHQNSKLIIDTLKTKKINIGVWVYDNDYVDGLENGFVLWPDIKEKGVPLRCIVADEASWNTIINQAKKML
jgi:hypothetical protein